MFCVFQFLGPHGRQLFKYVVCLMHFLLVYFIKRHDYQDQIGIRKPAIHPWGPRGLRGRLPGSRGLGVGLLGPRGSIKGRVQ